MNFLFFSLSFLWGYSGSLVSQVNMNSLILSPFKYLFYVRKKWLAPQHSAGIKSSLKAIHPSSKNLQHLSYCFIICPLILWVEHTFISVFMWVHFSLWRLRQWSCILSVRLCLRCQLVKGLVKSHLNNWIWLSRGWTYWIIA